MKSVSVNKSYTSGVFPILYKIAKIVPFFKNKLKLYYNNYRPISLLSNISKIIEKIIHIRLIKFLEENNYFYDFQFGCQLHSLTITAHVNICQSLKVFRINYIKVNYAARAFVELKKVFNTVDHDILINKLKHYGIRGVTKEWFSSYLKNSLTIH